MGASSSTESNLTAGIQRHLSKIVVAPSFAASLFFVYGFILWTGYMAFSKSRMLQTDA